MHYNMISFKFIIVGAVFLYTYLLTCIKNSESAIVSNFNVVNYGAKCDGKTDDSKPILEAWKQACNSNIASTVVIPPGNYILGPVDFQGPCKAAVTVRVEGYLRAPSLLDVFKSRDGWIVFRDIRGLTIEGGGTFDGQGIIAWKENNCAKSGSCSMPTNIRFTGITNGEVNNITSLDSKMFHMNILNCNYMTFKDITIDAPVSSPNTDGIHIGRSSMINITGATIKTGDDCVSLGDGSQHISINNVTCGPGHGISVGSLGKYPGEQPVEGVIVRNCTLVNTMNGLRVKTWPNSFNGIASGLHFQDIIMDNVSNPVLIDQDYCPDDLCKLQVPSKVKVSDVLFKNIKGTSATKIAIQLKCSKIMPCENVTLDDIDLGYLGNKGNNNTATSECFNVRPAIMGKLSPPPCLGS